LIDEIKHGIIVVYTGGNRHQSRTAKETPIYSANRMLPASLHSQLQ
jgi:hypothetical protein